MTDITESILGDLKTRLRGEMTQIAQDAASRIIEISSIPVGRQGGRIIRSLPGEAPRKEKADYIKTIRSEVTEDGDIIRATAFSDFRRSQWLEEGTSRMKPRPHFAKIFTEMQNSAPQRIETALKS